MYAGFVGTDNKFYDGILEEGLATIVPRDVVHFSMNVTKGPAYAVATFNSENPGAQQIPHTMFGSSANIGDVVLAKGFGISETTAKSLKAQFKAKFGDVWTFLDVSSVVTACDSQLFSRCFLLIAGEITWSDCVSSVLTTCLSNKISFECYVA